MNFFYQFLEVGIKEKYHIGVFKLINCFFDTTWYYRNNPIVVAQSLKWRWSTHDRRNTDILHIESVMYPHWQLQWCVVKDSADILYYTILYYTTPYGVYIEILFSLL